MTDHGRMENPDTLGFDLEGFQTPPEPLRQPWPPAAKAAVGVGTGCAVLVLLIAAVFWASIGLIFGARVPTGLQASAQVPPKATVGTATTLTLTVKNAGTTPVMVTSISAPPDVLSRLTLSSPKPPPRSPSPPVFGTQMWTYEQQVAPGETWTVKFNAIPQRAGPLEGRLRLQIGLATEGVPFKLRVAEKPRARAGPPG
jgi:hypothetical protein